MKQLVSIENITIKRGSGFNIIVHKNRWLPKVVVHKPARYHTSVEGNDLMSVSQVKPKLCEQNQVGLPEYVWEQRNVKDGPEFDQVLRWFVPSTNWRWKCAALLV
jgi:hypothetical protein